MPTYLTCSACTDTRPFSLQGRGGALLCVPQHHLTKEKAEFGNELRARSTTCCFLKWDLKQLSASLTQVHKLLREPDTLAHLPTPPTRAQ